MFNFTLMILIGTLIVLRLSTDDSGEYVCEAFNLSAMMKVDIAKYHVNVNCEFTFQIKYLFNNLKNYYKISCLLLLIDTKSFKS